MMSCDVIRKLAFLALFIVLANVCFAKDKPFFLKSGNTVRIELSDCDAPVVNTAARLLAKDLRNVLDDSLQVVERGAQIVAGTVDGPGRKYCAKSEQAFLRTHKEGFVLKVIPDGRLFVVGSDAHGVAYGLLEVSRKLGVSPWEWWADATPRRLAEFTIEPDFVATEAPAVEFRGIFINDEDWGLMPWSYKTMEPGNPKGVIGPETTSRIFELLLRLRANTYWPPMHECSVPFFLTPGNREVAKEYGIYIGSSHCEPMGCNAAGEWKRRGEGEYDYVNNSGKVYDFWEKRIREVAGQEMLYTIGMRGVHDSKMQGAGTVAEQKAVLEKVFYDQRGLLEKHIGKKASEIPQVFIPYKEVLDVYNAGLDVPDDVTLVWCDDNYGYIRHFPTEKELKRKGGNGIYYHVSYWGRPHDYLWLATFSPYLEYQQMREGFERGIRKMWILNVGDIKPAEYQIELFMDMAWNMDSVSRQGVDGHMRQFFCREFGDELAGFVANVMKEHYRLNYIRKPEFLGNTRTEEKDPAWKQVSDLPWSDSYIMRRLKEYGDIARKAEEIAARIPSDRADTYFQLVKYPVQAADAMNRKLLYAQLGRHGHGTWNESRKAYSDIKALTETYNEGIANGGKWNHIMDFQPRRLPVFQPVDSTTSVNQYPDCSEALTINAAGNSAGNVRPIAGLGYEGGGAAIAKDDMAVYTFALPEKSDSVTVTLKLLPTHPVNPDEGLKVSVSFDGGSPEVFDYATVGRSEEWKMNVLSNQVVCRLRFPVKNASSHSIEIRALSDGVVLDQIEIEK